jgi:hypothetical protein
LEGGAYIAQQPGEDGCLHSTAFPGLVLNAKALLDDDPAAVLARLNEAIGSTAHQDFAEKLAQQLEA